MEDILNDYISVNVHASIGRRWLGAAIDYLLLWVLYFVLFYSFGHTTIDAGGDTVQQVSGGFGFLIIVGSWFAIIPGIESINNGQSIGKAIVGVKTIKMNGKKAGFGYCLARHLFDMVDYFPFLGLVGLIVAGNTDNSQRVGDLVASTIVVNAR